MNKKYKKIIVISSVAIGMTSFAVQILLFYYFMSISPHQANTISGQVYPLNNHGYIFYVTKGQNLGQDILRYAFFILAIGGGILETRWKTIRNIYNEIPKDLKIK